MIDQKNWDEFISLETQKNYFQDIKRSLMSDHDSGKKIYPKPKDFFKLFANVLSSISK